MKPIIEYIRYIIYNIYYYIFLAWCVKCKSHASWVLSSSEEPIWWCDKCVPRNCSTCNIKEMDDEGNIIETFPLEDWSPCVEILKYFNK